MESLDLPTSVDGHSWTWLLDVSRHLNVALEIVDERRVPVLPADTTETAAALRGLLMTDEPPLRSTISIATSSGPQAVAIDNRLYLCRGLSAAGMLIVAREMRRGGPSADETRLELEAIAAWLSRSVEATFSDASIDPSVDSHMVASLRRMLDEAVARGSLRGVVSAFVETLAVWLEIEVHAYAAADEGGRFSHSVSPVGNHSTVPAELDDDVVPAGTEMVRLSPPEASRFAFSSVPDDVLIRRIVTGGGSWSMVFAGTIERHDVARLTAMSDLCGGALRALTSGTAAQAAAIPEPSSPPSAAPTEKGERRNAHRPFQAWIERLASQTIQEGGQASVIVISIADEDVRPEFIQAQVTKIRNDLRPSDFAGSLAGGEIGILLRDTQADQAAAVSARLEKLLQWDVTTGKAIQPSIGVVCCSADSPLEGSILRAARENGAARPQR